MRARKCLPMMVIWKGKENARFYFQEWKTKVEELTLILGKWLILVAEWKNPVNLYLLLCRQAMSMESGKTDTVFFVNQCEVVL